jgi:serine/threonine protein phosphatase 1
MKEKNVWVIGDVHGEYDTLSKLLKKIPTGSEIVFVGDLIDRGKHSSDVVELVRKNNYKVVLGNHELMFFCIYTR